MKPPPPMLPAVGCVTASANAVATAASTALPPLARIAAPASHAGADVQTTIPSFEGTPASFCAPAGGMATNAATVAAARTERRFSVMFQPLYPAPTRASILQRSGAVCDTSFRFGEALLPQRVERRAGGARDNQRDADLARRAVSTGRHVRRRRHQFLALLRSRPARRAVPVRRRGGRDARQSSRSDGALLAWVLPERAAGAALRLPGARPVGAPSRDTGAIPTSCCWIRTRRRSTARGRGTSRCSRITSTTRTARRTISTTRPHMPKSVVVNQAFDWGDDRLRGRRGTRRSSTRRT